MNPLTPQERHVQRELMRVELKTIHAEHSEFSRRKYIKVYSSEDVISKQSVKETIK